MESIFVQISSYHDYELPKTIMDILNKSSGDFQINFGIHHIYFQEDDIEIPNLPNVNVAISKAPSNLGMGLGRKIAHQFYNGEDYYLQVDAHSRFDPNWDRFIVGEIKRYQAMGFAKPLLTMYPRNYWYEEDGSEHFDEANENSTYISFHENKQLFMDMRFPSQTAMPNENNIFCKSVSGGCIFTVGDFVIPNDKIFANGEEFFIAARAWTRGYDILLPSRMYMSHLYYDGNNKPKNRRRLVWEDVSGNLLNVLTTVSYTEIKKMFTENLIGPDYLGTERTLEEFGTYAGVDFNTGEVFDQIC